ncbi:hypothetical protein PSN45_005266 [Yamadazyma tenuis]|uniref:DUF654-domain-containing protein n=1 Tax=Candida tenuis (strain ATCC 10573 / BCRC 21748 / CBS 615 / JCM 9827 / NBRC 10315 / NRRL Y-1498 / VKM Y-70) TaxID=590646 RepID=G3B195_CANTC|nr:uncharacterized protein CANTEDRAFT_121092 [Yamadazyma tenuis ATCC 10573]EGV64913.1 hypothetical protein CANTEDRAFT_121092 [Yamadazyma tenuis ATCC 10573]WEJ97708.1 hypothetical protein PSN45_005266 [Yamadazyma tenuis]
MSSRQLRKLERQRLEHSLTPEATENVKEINETPVTAKTFNAFSFLEDGDSEPDSEEVAKHIQDITEPESLPKSSSKPKKNKKNNKKGKKAVIPENSDDELDRILAEAKAEDLKKYGTQEQTHESQVIVAEDGDDFEEEYNEDIEPLPEYDPNFKNFTTERLQQSLSILSIGSIKNLDPDEELKSLFGNLSLETIEDANTTTSLAVSPEVLKQFKRLARLTKGWGGKDKRSVPGTTRKLLLTRIKDDYLPTQQKPLQMEELDSSEILDLMDYKENVAEISELELKIRKEKKIGVRYFSFRKNSTVQERVANTQFYASVVISPDHDALIALLRNYPYHVETLLQVSMVLLRQGSDKSTSNALIEKCLFVFDRCFHKFFHDLLSDASNGLVRLPYESFMNRQFYLCIFRYITNLGERATYFTSLSFCKLLLSFSPAEDPLGVRYFIDYYAIMSQEYKFLTYLVESPLVTSYVKWFTPGIAFSTVLAYLHLNDTQKAEDLLKKAFLAHPYTAFQMLETIGLATSISVRETDIFVNDEIILANQTYMVRAKELWKGEDKRKFLNEQLTTLFDAHKGTLNREATKASGVRSLFSNLLGTLSTPPSSNAHKELPFNLLRFAILSGENSIMAKVPQEVWSRDDVYEFDPLPPSNDTLGYSAISGVEEGTKIIDGALDYVDQNVLASIIQNRTQNDEFEDIVRQLQEEQLQQPEGPNN